MNIKFIIRQAIDKWSWVYLHHIHIIFFPSNWIEEHKHIVFETHQKEKKFKKSKIKKKNQWKLLFIASASLQIMNFQHFNFPLSYMLAGQWKMRKKLQNIPFVFRFFFFPHLLLIYIFSDFFFFLKLWKSHKFI